MFTEESDERSHNSVEETARGPKRRFALFFMHHRIRALRFLRKPGRDYSNGHTCPVDTVGHAPAHCPCHDEDKGIRSQERQAVAELIGRREEALFFSVVCRFNAPSRLSPAFEPIPPIAASASPTTICENIIHPRRCPSRLNNGKSTRSIKGAHRNFSEYAMPTQERNPIAVREVCSSRSQ